MELMDYVLVTLGLGLMVAYHMWLLYMVVKHPTKTVIGINSFNRKAWVYTMMETGLLSESSERVEQNTVVITDGRTFCIIVVDQSRNGILAVQTIRNNIMASTLIASTAIMLCSLVAMLMTETDTGHKLVNSDSKHVNFSLKSLFILSCFLVAFLMNVQSIRYYNHASILINAKRSSHLTPEYVAGMVNRGSYFWSIGLRAFYFSFPLFLWIFGSVPMCLCCVALVCMLRALDVSSNGMVVPEESEEMSEFVGNNGREDTALTVRIK